MERLPSGFYKVAHNGGSYVTATFYNPTTNETISCCVRDYDYDDGSRDNDDLYFMEINEEARRRWQHSKGIILVGDVIEVFKGRKVPIGTVARVEKIVPFKDRYGRAQAIYYHLDNGMKTNMNNCKLVEEGV